MMPEHGISVLAASSVYETEPVGEVVDQPDFLNACVRIQTALGPMELLSACKAIEHRLGREPSGIRHGPRPIDVDLLLLGDTVLVAERLCLPHAEVLSRRFVIVPLLELDAELTLPDGRSVSAGLERLGDAQAVNLVHPPLLIS